MDSESIQGDEWDTYSRARHVMRRRNAGSPKGREPYGDGAPIVVRAGESPVHGEGGQVISTPRDREVLGMRNAETVLGVIRDKGTRGLPLEDIYRQLYNPDLYLRAYARLYSNSGAMTPGATPETVDGMSLTKIEKLIACDLTVMGFGIG